MTITTSDGKTIPIESCWAPVGPARELWIHLRDARPLSEIAADFEGCEHFHRASEAEGDMDYDGYTVLVSISRPFREVDPDAVQIALARPERS